MTNASTTVVRALTAEATPTFAGVTLAIASADKRIAAIGVECAGYVKVTGDTWRAATNYLPAVIAEAKRVADAAAEMVAILEGLQAKVGEE